MTTTTRMMSYEDLQDLCALHCGCSSSMQGNPRFTRGLVVLGLRHVLYLYFEPFPHVTLQGVDSLQLVQLPEKEQKTLSKQFNDTHDT